MNVPYLPSHSPILLPDILGSGWVSDAGMTDHKWTPSQGMMWQPQPTADVTVGYTATTNFRDSSLTTTGGPRGGSKV